MPGETAVKLKADKHDLAADYFLERREIGIINIGGTGTISVDGESYTLAKQDGLYIGKGAQDVTFTSAESANPAQFYLFSTPAHVIHPTAHLKLADAEPLHLGDPLNSNKRTIYKYIHPDGTKTRHLVMRDREAVISPSWSIHSGMGTGSYTFIWAMAGENQSFADMDAVTMDELR